MKILTLRAFRFWAIVCAFSVAGITGSSGAQIAAGGTVSPLDRSGVTPLLTPSVVASGLENPRGIKFGPDGRLYVAEGGLGAPIRPWVAVRKFRLRSDRIPADTRDAFRR